MENPKLKVGDIIRREDILYGSYIIIGESSEQKQFWEVESVNNYNKSAKITGFIAKNDERWEVVPKGN